MSFFLPARRTDLVEAMDKADCDQDKLFTTYRQFRTINMLLSQWHRIFHLHMLPYLKIHQTARVLDIGCGGGDISIYLAKKARRLGFTLQITAADPDERAMEFIESEAISDPHIIFEQKRLETYLQQGKTYDFVISNHLMHHLDETDLRQMLNDCEVLTHHKVLFNDIRRGFFAIPLFWCTTAAFFRNSFIVQDGLKSIKRSFTPDELRAVCPHGWQVTTLFPYRLLLVYTNQTTAHGAKNPC